MVALAGPRPPMSAGDNRFERLDCLKKPGSHRTLDDR
jgi:hypothetical protein